MKTRHGERRVHPDRRQVVSPEAAQAELRHERALREAIMALASSFTVESIIEQIARSSLIALDADASFVERIDKDRNEVEVVGVAGELAPTLGVTVPYQGSYAQLVIESKEAERIAKLGSPERPMPKVLTDRCNTCPAVVVPLLDSGEAMGALFTIRTAARHPFSDDDLRRGETFAELAALAFRKVHLLDISERARKELERVMASRARLLRGFGHDLRNPLGAANGYVQLLRDGLLGGPLNAEQRDGVERAGRAVSTAIKLVDDLVEYSQLESGRLEIRREPVDLRDLVRELVGPFQLQTDAKGLALHTAIPDAFPVIRSDSARISQILGNLLSNAVKYTERGEIAVMLRVAADGEGPAPGRWVATEVADTGLGIEQRDIDSVFEEFTRLDPDAAPGMGIGLPFSQRLAQALGGTITVQSERGKGSVFTLWLPMGNAGPMKSPP